jgi:uncharacterized oligopeptide transporter (OPT) family protein
MCGAILLITCAVGVDMQQDRSTGWRLGTNRVIQFRFQVIGVLMGAVLAVLLSKVFMQSYPVLRENLYANPALANKQWNSAMTFKFIGALESLTHPKPFVIKALLLGIAIGIGTEIARKILKSSAGYRRFSSGSKTGKTTDFVLDAVVLPSPYASSFGGFVELPTTVWFAIGGVISSVYDSLVELFGPLKGSSADNEAPADMGGMSLIGGGLIAGDSLAALAVGVTGLLTHVF